MISMKDIFKEALSELGVFKNGDERWLVEFEREKDKEELIEDLKRYLPEKISEILLNRLVDKDFQLCCYFDKNRSIISIREIVRN